MGFANNFEKTFRTLLPSPFSIALGLTVITFWLAYFFTDFHPENKIVNLLKVWEEGMWEKGLLAFLVQMMLMLVLGHVLALTKPINNLISNIANYCNTTSKAAFIVTFSTIIIGFINWGLALIFGAIFARKVGEKAFEKGFQINYPLIGAAGYVGLMVWHGGISGSSLVKVAESGHLKDLMKDSSVPISFLPDFIPFDDTVFSLLNISASILILIIIPFSMYWLGKKLKPSKIKLENSIQTTPEDDNSTVYGAERFDYSKTIAFAFGGVIILLAILKASFFNIKGGLSFINPNYINFVLLGFGILFHQSIHKFLKAVEEAISGSVGILIQFPLYFGIMALMNKTGLVVLVSDAIVDFAKSLPLAPENSLPMFTFFSSGLVNIFVPSGGGQWGVQGPIIIQSAYDMGVPLNKSIMALAYGDQLTNMLQPFWALPLLGITGLKARDILPYTLFMMVIAGIIYLSVLLFF